MTRTVKRGVVEGALQEMSIALGAIREEYHARGLLTGWGLVAARDRLPMFGACLVRAVLVDLEFDYPGIPASDAIRFTDDTLRMLRGARLNGTRTDVVVFFPGWQLRD